MNGMSAVPTSDPETTQGFKLSNAGSPDNCNHTVQLFNAALAISNRLQDFFDREIFMHDTLGSSY
jgi:hypothetical protein